MRRYLYLKVAVAVRGARGATRREASGGWQIGGANGLNDTRNFEFRIRSAVRQTWELAGRDCAMRIERELNKISKLNEDDARMEKDRDEWQWQ